MISCYACISMGSKIDKLFRGSGDAKVMYWHDYTTTRLALSESKYDSASPTGWSRYEGSSLKFSTAHEFTLPDGPIYATPTRSRVFNQVDGKVQNQQDPVWRVTISEKSGSLTDVQVTTNGAAVGGWGDTWVSAAWAVYGEPTLGWVWNHGGDLLRIGFGAFDVVTGVPWSATSLGAIAGVPLAAYGVDQVITGTRNIAYGKRDRAGVEELVYAATGSETAAVLLPAAATLSLWAVGPRLARVGVRAEATLAMPAFRPEHALSELQHNGIETLTAVELAAARANVGRWTLLRLYLGRDVRVPAIAGFGSINNVPQNLTQLIADITAITGRESALLPLRDGRFVVRLGKSGTSVGTARARWDIAHTHPNGNMTLSIRGEQEVFDTLVLTRLRQDWTIIVGVRGSRVGWITIDGMRNWERLDRLIWEFMSGGR